MSTNPTVPEAKNRSAEHKVVSREEWVAARKELLKTEKELTRRSDEYEPLSQQAGACCHAAEAHASASGAAIPAEAGEAK